MVNSIELDRSFTALAHPLRRRIIERLSEGPATVGVAAAGADVSPSAITKHIRILEDAGLVARTVEGRTHRLVLKRQRLEHAAGCIDGYRRIWERKFAVIDEHLVQRRAARKS
jgi:DNA-binding transcriptional ArsR family regulator